jgi:hypothetical protein
MGMIDCEISRVVLMTRLIKPVTKIITKKYVSATLINIINFNQYLLQGLDLLRGFLLFHPQDFAQYAH